MPINTSTLTPGQAIKSATIAFQAMAELRREDPSALLLSIFLSGEPGVGKSTIARGVARNLGARLVEIGANQLSPEVAAGVHTMDYETNTTIWMPPSWMPAEDGSDGPTLLFFDELTAADDRVRKPLFGAFLDGALNGRRFPDNCFVMAAGNEAETGTMVFEFDNATISRFITYRIGADLTSWLDDFAIEAKITLTTAGYLKANVGRFCMTEEALSANMALYGNPRSWHHVSNTERAIMRADADRADPDKREALLHNVAGKVGIELAEEYMAAFDSITQMSNLYDLLRATPERRRSMWPTSHSQLYALTYSMMSYPTDGPSARLILDLADEMPIEHELPFQDAKVPLVEVIHKRLTALGVSAAEIDRHLEKESTQIFEDLVEQGPILRCA